MITYAILDGTRVRRYEVFGEQQSNLFLVGEGSVFWPTPPSPMHELHVIDGVLTFTDPRTLAEAQAAKWEQIKSARDANIAAPKVTSHGTLDADPDSRTRIAEALEYMRASGTRSGTVFINFTLSNNTSPQMTYNQLETIVIEMGAQIQALRNTATALRSDIYAATTIAAVDAIVWPT